MPQRPNPHETTDERAASVPREQEDELEMADDEEEFEDEDSDDEEDDAEGTDAQPE